MFSRFTRVAPTPTLETIQQLQQAFGINERTSADGDLRARDLQARDAHVNTRGRTGEKKSRTDHRDFAYRVVECTLHRSVTRLDLSYEERRGFAKWMMNKVVGDVPAKGIRVRHVAQLREFEVGNFRVALAAYRAWKQEAAEGKTPAKPAWNDASVPPALRLGFGQSPAPRAAAVSQEPVVNGPKHASQSPLAVAGPQPLAKHATQSPVPTPAATAPETTKHATQSPLAVAGPRPLEKHETQSPAAQEFQTPVQGPVRWRERRAQREQVTSQTPDTQGTPALARAASELADTQPVHIHALHTASRPAPGQRATKEQVLEAYKELYASKFSAEPAKLEEVREAIDAVAELRPTLLKMPGTQCPQNPDDDRLHMLVHQLVRIGSPFKALRGLYNLNPR